MKAELKTLRSAVVRLEQQHEQDEVAGSTDPTRLGVSEVVGGAAPAQSNVELSEVETASPPLRASLGTTEAHQDQQQAAVQESPSAAAEEVTVQQQPLEQQIHSPQQQQQQPRQQQQQSKQSVKHFPDQDAEHRPASGSSTPNFPRGGNTSLLSTRSSMARVDSTGPRAESTPALQVAGFRIECPRVPKQARQQRDRCQHWGPEPIAAEYLAALKESWKVCVPERLYTGMFSDRMEDQLPALHSWRAQVTAPSAGLLETLDMLLKWLTWMLLNTNTQVWRLTLEVFSCLLELLASEGIQLSDREAQILLPNILERSGHNMPALREFMEGILRRSLPLYPRLKILPMVLHAKSSKNKRSAAIALRFLAEMLDRQIGPVLAKSQKELSIISKLMDDKDGEVRRAALHAVACLSQHVDSEVFERVLAVLPKLLQTTVRSAASRMSPAQPSSALEVQHEARPRVQRQNSRDMAASRQTMSARTGQPQSFLRSPRAGRPESPAPRAGCGMQQRLESPQRNRQTPPARHESPQSNRHGLQQRPESPQPRVRHGLQHRPESPEPSVRRSKSQQSTLPSPQRRVPSRAASAGRETRVSGSRLVAPRTEVRRPNDSPSGPEQSVPFAATPSDEVPEQKWEPAPTVESDWTTESLTRRLLDSNTEAFQALCGELKARTRRITVEEAPPLAEAIINAMREYIGGTPDSVRCECLVGLIEEFCTSRDCLKLPVPILRKLLLEQLRHLQHSSWSRHIDKGGQISRTLNLSCVLFMHGIRRCMAYDLMLDIGTSEPEAVHGSLIVKCLKKLNKNMDPKRSDSKRCDDAEAEAVIEVVRGWVQKVGPKITSALNKMCSEEENQCTEGNEGSDVIAGACEACWKNEASLVVLLEGVKEVIETVSNTFPNLAPNTGIFQLDHEVTTILQEWKRKFIQGKQKEDKENQHQGAVANNRREMSPFKDGQGCTKPVKRRQSSPAQITPCKERNSTG